MSERNLPFCARDAIEYLKSIPPDEPVFVLRAQDNLADQLVDEWHIRAALSGKCAQDKINNANNIAEAMRAWGYKKDPD